MRLSDNFIKRDLVSLIASRSGLVEMMIAGCNMDVCGVIVGKPQDFRTRDKRCEEFIPLYFLSMSDILADRVDPSHLYTSPSNKLLSCSTS